jgi:hypothetical protein
MDQAWWPNAPNTILLSIQRIPNLRLTVEVANMSSSSSFARDIRPAVRQFISQQWSENWLEGTSRGWLRAPTIFLALVLLTSGLTLAQADPFVGTWKLDVAKSKFGPGTERKSETRIVESSPTGMKVSVDRTNADGSNQQYNYTTNFDGRPHPITGMAPYGADSIAVTLGAYNNLSIKLMKGGKEVGSGTSLVSADGKTLTLTSKGTDASGKTVSSVSVYEKQ